MWKVWFVKIRCWFLHVTTQHIFRRTGAVARLGSAPEETQKHHSKCLKSVLSIFISNKWGYRWKIKSDVFDRKEHGSTLTCWYEVVYTITFCCCPSAVMIPAGSGFAEEEKYLVIDCVNLNVVCLSVCVYPHTLKPLNLP